MALLSEYRNSALGAAGSSHCRGSGGVRAALWGSPAGGRLREAARIGGGGPWGTLAAMEPDRPHTIAASSGRSFATFPAAVVVPIVNRREELLLLQSPRSTGWWEPVNGAVDDGESLLDAALREVREEAGPDLRVRPLGVVHAATFAYDARVRRMISVVYLMAHEAGAVVPGDDMRGSRLRWATLSAIESDGLRLVPPFDQAWLRQRTVDLFRLWEPEPAVLLQGPFSARGWNKADQVDPGSMAPPGG